jgi:hypothetical protein
MHHRKETLHLHRRLSWRYFRCATCVQPSEEFEYRFFHVIVRKEQTSSSVRISALSCIECKSLEPRMPRMYSRGGMHSRYDECASENLLLGVWFTLLVVSKYRSECITVFRTSEEASRFLIMTIFPL